MIKASQLVNSGQLVGRQAKVSIQFAILILIASLHVITTVLNGVGWS